MLRHYDRNGATTALSAITDMRANNPHVQLQLAKMFKTEGSPYRAEKDGGIWRLVFNNTGQSPTEEVVASVQGILCKKGLPPFLDQIGTNSNNTRYLKQSAQITGYGNQAFERLTSDLARIQAIFKRAIGPQLQDELGFSQQDGFMAIDASNRYFSLRSERNQADECLITEEMDPKGYLRRAAGTKYVHTEENKVYYFEMCEDGTGETSFKETGPHIFQEGDIVELQLSFIVVPLRDQKSRMSIILRSISLLEGKFTQDAFVKAASTETISKASIKTTLKRKVGYINEEVSITRTKLARMEIAEEREREATPQMEIVEEGEKEATPQMEIVEEGETQGLR